MSGVQHVWLDRHASSFVVPCDGCLETRESLAARHSIVRGRLSHDAEVGVCSCVRGHRIVVRRGAGSLAATG